MSVPTREYAYKIFSLLKQHYPKAQMILQWGNNWELMVAIMLSAQCTDIMVNKVTAKLFPKYRELSTNPRKQYAWDNENYTIDELQWNEIVTFATVPRNELEHDIKSTGFYHNKAKNIQAAAKVLLETYHGIFPRTMKELIALPGVGRKTANVFLGNAYQIYEGIAVDTHVRKQAQLLGLTTNTNPDKIEQDLMKLYDQKDWFTLTYLLIEHGRNMRRKKTERKICDDKKCRLCNL